MQVSVPKCLPGVRGTLLQHLDDRVAILAILFRGLGSRPGADSHRGDMRRLDPAIIAGDWSCMSMRDVSSATSPIRRLNANSVQAAAPSPSASCLSAALAEPQSASCRLTVETARSQAGANRSALSSR